MPILARLNETGYFQVKKDRDKLEERINELISETEQLQEMLREFDSLCKRLRDYYEPNIKIKKVHDNYVGSILIRDGHSRTIHFVLGEVKYFKDEKDKKLLKLAEEKGREKLKEKFPLFFDK